MADEPVQIDAVFAATGSPNLPQLVDYLVETASSPETLKKLETALGNAQAKAAVVAEGVAAATLKPLIEDVAVPIAHVILKTLLGVLASAEPITDEIGKVALEAVLGERPRRGYVPDDVGKRVLEKLAPPGGEVQPGIEGAARYVSTMVNLQMEPWLLGVLAEVFGDALDMLRGAGGALHSVAELREIIAQVFGGGRITRRVLAPFIDAGIVAPARWHTNKQYRPELLGTGDAVRHYLRGRWSREQLREELARQGWSDERIDALVLNATKRLTIDQLLFLFYRGTISDADVLTRTRDLGYDDATAAALIEIEIAQRRDRALAPVVDAAVDAFLRGDLDDAALRRTVEGAAPNYKEAQDVINAAHVRRELRTRSLSAAEERRLVVAGIRSVLDYHRALVREGRTEDAATALELELRVDLQERKDIGAARAAAAADRAAAAKAAADAKAARDAELAERKALPTLQEYERAYVRGRLARDQFAAAIQREKIAITPADLELLLADADDGRARYLADQETRAKAATSDAGSVVSLAKIEESVIRGILGIDDYARELDRRGVNADDSRILVALLNARLEDQADATAQREAAAQRAQFAGISLPAFERAVRLGLRTRADYAALLDALRMTAPAKALVLDLLDAQLETDAGAAAQRQALEGAGQAKGLALAQRRRIVIAGVRPIEYYADALSASGWPVEDQLAELDLVQAEIDDRAAAEERQAEIEAEQEERRQRQAEAQRRDPFGAPAPAEASALSLSQVQRAVRLGILETDALRAWLSDRGYGADDVETIVRLTIADVPNVRAGQALEETVAADLAKKGVQLADLKSAVRRGLRTLAQYGEDLAGRGYGEDAVALLAELLREELAIDVERLASKIRTVLEGVDGAPTLEELVAAAAAGEVTGDELRAVLEHFGVPHDTALVYARLAPNLSE